MKNGNYYLNKKDTRGTHLSEGEKPEFLLTNLQRTFKFVASKKGLGD